LDRDWPHAIGTDDNGKALIWKTKTPQTDWKAVMQALTTIRKQANANAIAKESSARRWINGADPRIPNSLRFKVRKEGGKFVGVIFHVPCKPPDAFHPNIETLEAVWGDVYDFLDGQAQLSRSAS
jgi:CRISPR-associated protein Cmr1